ncbi:MAG: F0F1 ATP synthase subunit delta [Alphaproteobacteria bacterium]|nr:MAG: F0F1 ATP synthase subunit delta [Alphaproteobacteria bacterium]
MSDYSEVFTSIPEKYLNDLSAGIRDIYSFKVQNKSLWDKIPLLETNWLDNFNLNDSSKIFLSILSQTNWEQFNDILDNFHDYLTIVSQINNQISVITCHHNPEIEKRIEQEIENIIPNCNITFTANSNILGGFILDIGSTRIDASYANILGKFIGAAHESFNI